MIRVREVSVIGDDGEPLGTLPTEEALSIARDQDLDLVEVAPTANPPVCRIMDYGKHKYKASKKAHEAKKKQKTKKRESIPPRNLAPIEVRRQKNIKRNEDKMREIKKNFLNCKSIDSFMI